MVADGLQNIIQTYQSDDEEPPLMQEQHLHAALPAELPHDQVAANLLEIAAVSPPPRVEEMVVSDASVAQALESQANVQQVGEVGEPSLVYTLPLADSRASEIFLPSQATGSSDGAIHCNTGHITTSRGSLEPVANLEDLQSGLQGNWVNQINEHFSMAPSLLGLKYIQLAATANNDHVVSEEGLLLWKKHFHEQSVENKKLLFCQHSCKLV